MSNWQEKICGAFILFTVASVLIPAAGADDIIPPGQDNNPTMPASNPNSWQVPSVMPTLPAISQTDSAGSITIGFTSGSLFRNQLSDLWAQVIYDGRIEYWDLDPAMLASDNKSLNMQFEPKFDGKLLRIEFYAFDKQGKKTSLTNPIDITVNSSLSPIPMPTLPATSATNATGKITINFTSGSLLANQLNELWAGVNFDGKNEFWKLPLGILASDGRSINLQFEPQFRGKRLRLRLYGFDKNGKQTEFTNFIEIEIAP